MPGSMKELPRTVRTFAASSRRPLPITVAGSVRWSEGTCLPNPVQTRQSLQRSLTLTGVAYGLLAMTPVQTRFEHAAKSNRVATREVEVLHNVASSVASSGELLVKLLVKLSPDGARSSSSLLLVQFGILVKAYPDQGGPTDPACFIRASHAAA